jgi:hypothetical protein
MAFRTEIAARVERDAAQKKRLERQVAAGTVALRGRQLRQRAVRIEFWSYSRETEQMSRHARLKLKVWGWTAAEVHRILVAALEEDRKARVRAARAKSPRTSRVEQPNE